MLVNQYLFRTVTLKIGCLDIHSKAKVKLVVTSAMDFISHKIIIALSPEISTHFVTVCYNWEPEVTASPLHEKNFIVGQEALHSCPVIDAVITQGNSKKNNFSERDQIRILLYFFPAE